MLILGSDHLKAGPRAFPRYVVPASAGGAPTLPDALDCLIQKNSSSSERNERSERIRGLDANADTHLPGEWQLPKNFFTFGILRFFRPSNCRIKVDELPPEGGTTCLWSPGFSRFLV